MDTLKKFFWRAISAIMRAIVVRKNIRLKERDLVIITDHDTHYVVRIFRKGEPLYWAFGREALLLYPPKNKTKHMLLMDLMEEMTKEGCRVNWSPEEESGFVDVANIAYVGKIEGDENLMNIDELLERAAHTALGERFFLKQGDRVATEEHGTFFLLRVFRNGEAIRWDNPEDNARMFQTDKYGKKAEKLRAFLGKILPTDLQLLKKEARKNIGVNTPVITRYAVIGKKGKK